MRSKCSAFSLAPVDIIAVLRVFAPHNVNDKTIRLIKNAGTDHLGKDVRRAPLLRLLEDDQ